MLTLEASWMDDGLAWGTQRTATGVIVHPREWAWQGMDLAGGTTPTTSIRFYPF